MQSLKAALMTTSVLALSFSGVPTALYIDACNAQIDCCLLPTQPGVRTKPTVHLSWLHTGTKQRNDTTQRECRAIVWYVLHLRSYPKASWFTMRTDHDAPW